LKGIKMSRMYSSDGEFMGYNDPAEQEINWDKEDIPECPNELKNLSKRKMKKAIKKIVKEHIKYLSNKYQKDLNK
jgi:hypothetical protein